MRQDVTSAERSVATDAIRQARSTRDVEDARRLFSEYVEWLNVDLCFQDFERELATLPGAYSPPAGRLLLAGEPGAAFACIALRPLASARGCGTLRLDFQRSDRASGSSADARAGSAASRVESEAVAEVKRLYVQPTRRGERWGERLARALLCEARAIGYREAKLDTLAWMSEARALYARLGFRPCAPYYDNPLEGAVYMSLAL